MSTIVIAGAAGRIGFNAARAFVAAGWTVRGIARGEKLKRLPQGVEPVEADAFDRQAMIDACAGADVVLHALNPTYDKWATHVVPMAENVLAAAKAAGATLMLPGNVYNFGTGIGMDTSEDAPMPADTEKGRLRVDIEEKFRAAAAEGVQTIVLRAGDFFGGPVDGSWLDLVIAKDLRKNRFVWPGRLDVPHAFAYLPDFGAAFVAVAEKRGELGRFERFHLSGHTVTGAQFHTAMEAAVGRSLKPGSVPWRLLRIVGLFNPVLREVIKMRYLWDVPHSLDGSKLAALIGTEPHTPLDDALRQAVADLKLDGERR
ncbi:NAD-dependent epimerase/dehydratase family protein [Roseitalea porphyridii]|uniref:NAD-dependent epimerase/dehydratase family protein n=1 Tax=Roseitalea porphyridii TaxID=1852022 RepID=A0A4P6V5L2_9HYPH|nr:NAD(P)H-binding protein [Roseitalea porphyridii]QBK32124.1 NAD-dependent epimerase/dehydratase family protein [Roseitalea porphyridii]